jgi:molybdopterin synthase sulfur carrier subunit
MSSVKFYAGLRKAAGVKETSISASTLRGALDVLVEHFPPLQQQVWDGTDLRPHIVITINGHPVDPERGLDIPVSPGDQIAIFPPIAGG